MITIKFTIKSPVYKLLILVLLPMTTCIAVILSLIFIILSAQLVRCVVAQVFFNPILVTGGSILNMCSGSRVVAVPANTGYPYKNGKTTADITNFDCPKGYPVTGVMVKRGGHGASNFVIDGISI